MSVRYANMLLSTPSAGVFMHDLIIQQVFASRCKYEVMSVWYVNMLLNTPSAGVFMHDLIIQQVFCF